MNSQAQPRPGSGRMILALIAGIPVTVILAATWLWYFVERGELDLVNVLGTANAGVLLSPPRQIGEHSLTGMDGSPFAYDQLSPRWTLLVPVRGSCDVDCERRLYLIRQIHAAMGKEQNRIRRIFVGDRPVNEVAMAVNSLSDGRPLPADFVAYLQQEQRGMEAVSMSGEDFAAFFAGAETGDGTWFLVDPAGWMMMRYDESIHYKEVIADLKFLLKNSGV